MFVKLPFYKIISDNNKSIFISQAIKLNLKLKNLHILSLAKQVETGNAFAALINIYKWLM